MTWKTGTPTGVLLLGLGAGLASSAACGEVTDAEGAEDAAPADAAFTADAGIEEAIRAMPDSPTRICSDGAALVGCSGDELIGQDGHYEINVPSFASAAGAVEDQTTGLVWEEVATEATHADAVLHCQTQADESFAGRDDWRLPSYWEIASLYDMGRGAHAYAPAFPDYGANTFFWTASSVAGDESSAWVGGGNVPASTVRDKANLLLVRCVSGPAQAPDWVPGPSGATVLDRVTGLEWQQQPPSAPFDFASALAHCEDLELDGRSDWRLPSAKELYTIVDPTRVDPAADPVIQGMLPVAHWSSSPSDSNPGAAYQIHFGDGSGAAAEAMTSSAAIRCARGRPRMIDPDATGAR